MELHVNTKAISETFVEQDRQQPNIATEISTLDD